VLPYWQTSAAVNARSALARAELQNGLWAAARRECGSPEQHQPSKKGSGLTGHMPHMTNAVGERFNLTFSWAMHLLCLRLFVDGYNRYCLTRFPIDDPRPLTT
jgi:hypothetical protein